MKKRIIDAIGSHSPKTQAGITPLILLSDFGNADGAVNAMKGVAYSACSQLPIFDLTHDIPAFNIREGAERLLQAVPYWPIGTVFVSVIDPGVGTTRKSIAIKTKSQHYFIGPDNGTFARVAEAYGIESIREIDETINRRIESIDCHTFHGRDVYAYTGARLAAGIITFDECGPILNEEIQIVSPLPTKIEGNNIIGHIRILDPKYGNIWTNISEAAFNEIGIQDGSIFTVIIKHKSKIIYRDNIPYCKSFGFVARDEELIYINSIGNISIAINSGNFAKKRAICSGEEWTIELQPIEISINSSIQNISIKKKIA